MATSAEYNDATDDEKITMISAALLKRPSFLAAVDEPVSDISTGEELRLRVLARRRDRE